MGNIQMTEEASKKMTDHLIDRWLRSEGFERKHTLDDATGLFRAISDQLLFTQIHHLAVRAECIDFMRKNRVLFEKDINQPYDDYLDKMSTITGWPGETEIQAMSLLYERDFIIYNGMTKTRIVLTNNGFDESFYLCQSSSRHYESIFPKESIPLSACGELYPSVVDEKVDKMLHDAIDELTESFTKVDDKKDEDGNSAEFSEALSQLSLQSNNDQRQNTHLNNLRLGDSSEQNNHTGQSNHRGESSDNNAQPQMVSTQLPTAPQISSASAATVSSSSSSSSLPISGQQTVTSTATQNYQNYLPPNGNYYPVPTIVTSHQKTQDASNQQQPSLPSSYVCGGSKTLNFPPLMSQTVNTYLPTAPQISSPSASTVSLSSSSSSSLPIGGQQAFRSTAKTQDGNNKQQPPLLPQPSLPGSYGPKTMNFPPLMSEMVNIYLPTAPQISSPSASTVSLSSSSLPIGGQQAFTRTASRNYPNYPPINGNYCPVSTMLTPHQKTQVASNQQQLPLLPQPSLPSSYVIGGLKTMNFPPPMSQMVNTQFPTAPQISSASASASASTVSSSLPIGGQQAVRSTAKTQDGNNQQQLPLLQQPSLPSSYVYGGSMTFPPLMSQTVNTQLPTAPQISSPSASTVSLSSSSSSSSSSLPIGGQQAFTRTASRNYPNYPPINGNYYPDSTILTPHQKTQIASNQQQLPLPPQPPLSSSYIISQLKAANFPPPMSQMANTQLPTAPQISSASASASTVSSSSSSLPIGGQQAVRSTAKAQDGNNQQQPSTLPQPSLPGSYVCGGSKTMKFPSSHQSNINNSLKSGGNKSETDASNTLPAARSTRDDKHADKVNNDRHQQSNENIQPQQPQQQDQIKQSQIQQSSQQFQYRCQVLEDLARHLGFRQQQPSIPSSYVCGGSKTINFPPPMSQMVNTQLPTSPQISSASTVLLSSSSSLPIGGQQAVRSTAKTQDGNNQQQPSTLPQPSLPSSYVCGGSKTMKFPSSHQSNINNSSKSGGNKSETDASNTLPAARSTRDDKHADKVNNDRHQQSNDNIQPQQPQQQQISHHTRQKLEQLERQQEHQRQQIEHKRQLFKHKLQLLEHKQQQLAMSHQAEQEQLIGRQQQEQIWFQELIEQHSLPLVNSYREKYGLNFMLPNTIPDFNTVRNYIATNDINNIPPYILFIIEFGASILRMSRDITVPMRNDIANDHVAIPQEIQQQQQQVKPVVTESNTVPTTVPPVKPTISVPIPPQHINSGNDNITL